MLLITALCVFIAIQFSQGQVAGSLYAGSGNTKAGIGYDFTPRVWTELRMYGGVKLTDFTPELTGNYNF